MKPDGHKGQMIRCACGEREFWQGSNGKPKTCSRSCALRQRWGKLPSSRTAKAPSGYLWQRVPQTYPGAYLLGKGQKTAYILQHRYVMQEHLGRPLGRKEWVHHKNGVRTDNRLENLELWSGKKDPPGQRAQERQHCVTCRCFAR